MIKIIVKLKITVIILVYRGAAHRICNLKYSISKVAPVVLHNGLNYEYQKEVKRIDKNGNNYNLLTGL